MRDRTEFIICAANFYNDDEKHVHQPEGINRGFVVTGRRHYNCDTTFEMIMGTNERAMQVKQTEIRGFLTSKDRFVSRQEAYKIAYEADQIIGPNKGRPSNEMGLTSEDLYF